MTQEEINTLATMHGLEPSKQHVGSDERCRFFLTKDISERRYYQASISYGGPSEMVEVHVGLYGDRKIADDGQKSYASLDLAITDVPARFARLRGL
jgi:hypothetical protein